MSSVLAILFGVLQFHVAHAIDRLDIDTTSGPVKGFINETTPNVAQFLGIPYAEPPIGARRWLPALRKTKELRVITATHFGPSCPQSPGSEEDLKFSPNVYTVDALDFNPSPLEYQSEDCLSLNIWAPRHGNTIESNNKKRLPVIVWVYGGGYYTGGGNVPYQNPAPWVERSGKHIVVGINYRLSILGFPNAAGLRPEEQNLGMLDHRLAVEWVRDNIAKFGGDPNRITLWGQSAGAIAIDHYNFAYFKDPIVSGFIMHSGTAMLDFTSKDRPHTNFTFVARHFGCANAGPVAELECLRKVNASAIITFLKQYSENSTISSPTIVFLPVVDNYTLFDNHTTRALAGKISRKPAIIGNTANEGSSFVLPYNQTYGPGQDSSDTITVGLFMCPTIQTSHDRYTAKALTFRYLYAGNFSNISPQWWEGAYHSSDLPMVFGTYGITRNNGTIFQQQVSNRMQDYWLAFAEDPVKGLPKLGWKSYEGGAGEGVMFGADNQVVQQIAERRLDAPCNGLTPNGLPPPPR
ncbi:Alpha/Beta hydrolase protein [Phaeosphaeriaceae sp. PMI808]|nr:Alpha/Beta hydrolase protein [Phaeosphaeriaceae sp. PMI808]